MASNASKVKEIEEDSDMKCTVCQETFTDPRVLHCSHTFCLACLEAIVSASGKKHGGTIPCPICRKEFKIPEDGCSIIPKNFFVEHVIQMADVSLNELEKETVEKELPSFCDVCMSMKDETSVAKTPLAEMYCVDCQENLCNDCTKRHKVQKLGRDHQIVEIGSKFKEERKGISKEALVCEQHPSKILDYYCAECKKVVCILCFAGSHCSHRCSHVSKVSDELLNEIRLDVEKLSSCMTLNSERLMTLKKKREEFLKRIADSEMAILERSVELKRIINADAESLLRELASIKERELKKMEKENEDIEKRIFILKSLMFHCKELISKGFSGDICQSVDDVNKRTDDLKSENETICKRDIPDHSSVFKAIDWNQFFKTNKNVVGTIRVAELEKTFVVYNKATCWPSNVGFYKVRLINGYSSGAIIPTQFQIDVREGEASIAIAVHNNTLFVTGVGPNKDEIWGYNLNNNWTKRGQHQGRCNHSSTTISDKVYICGGLRESDQIALSSVEAFDTSTNSCTTVGHLVHSVYSAASVAVKSSIYIFGGYDKDHKVVDYIQVYETANNKCTLLKNPMPQPRACMKAALFEKSVILLGVDTCFIFNTETETWQEREELKTNARYFEMFLENGTLFVIFTKENNVMMQNVPVSVITNNEPATWKDYFRNYNLSGIYVIGGMLLLSL